jgi:hypothetical protein
LVCPTPTDCRETCRLKDVCPYGQIFEPSPPPGADRLSLNQDIPRPFVFRPPNGHQTTAQPGNALSFDVILIGKALDYFPYFLVTFRELGDQGIGLGRGRYRIARVSLLNEHGNAVAEVYSGHDNAVRPSPFRITDKHCRRLAAEWLAASQQRMAKNKPRCPCSGQRCTVRFLTLTLLNVHGTIVTRPDFHHVIKRLRDRVNALAHFSCDRFVTCGFQSLRRAS